jgi:hypothetical protein
MATPYPTPAPAKIFISYKRNVEPDHSLAGKVFEALQTHGHEVFIDRTLVAGQQWAKEIESKVRNSDCIIVFLTASSSQSEMVKGEIEIARDQAAKTAGRPHIVPVRLAYAAALPYPLNAWLDPIQYALWRGEADTPRLLNELVTAITGTPLPASTATFIPAPQRDGPPLYSASLPPPGGNLDVDDPWYIRRDPDDVAARLIARQGVTLVIKGSRQMGKSSLLVRMIDAAMKLNKRCALIDFQMFGQETLRSSSAFFQRFAESVADQLDLQHDVKRFWDAGLSDSQNFTRYMEKQILQPLDSFVLAIDEADILFQSEFLYDFFGMLRAWHNSRANPLKKHIWKKLDLVLVTSTEPYLFIDRDHESPFNVGEVMALSDFTSEQVQTLNALHDAPFFPPEVLKLHSLLHGQPYLTRKAFYVVKSSLTPDQLFARAAEDDGAFGDHLRNYFLRLLNYPELAAALKQVALGRGCSDPKLSYRLKGAGLVKEESGKIVPRCSLYAEYFRERL